VQLTPLSTHWAPRKKNKKRVQSFSDTVYIKSVLIYGAETWSLYDDDRRRIKAIEMDALR